MDIYAHNRRAWDREAAAGGRWSTPVGPELIASAREGRLEIFLTPNRPVPGSWLPHPLAGTRVLCLASGGGQQAPLLAAAGAEVTSFDASEGQLAKDRQVAEREGLAIRTVQGDMADLRSFEGASFDLIVHACSNCFVPDVNPVWREAFRVLRPGGALLAGVLNPIFYAVDPERDEQHGELVITRPIPYSDLEHLPPSRLSEKLRNEDTLEFGHSLGDQLGGQLAAGFHLTGLFEDGWSEEATHLVRYMPVFLATRALKP